MLLVPPHCSNPDSGTSITVRPCKNLAGAQRMLRQKRQTERIWIFYAPHKNGYFKMREGNNNKQRCTRIKSGWCPPPILHTSFGDSRALLLTISWRVFVSQERVSGPVRETAFFVFRWLPSDSVPFQKQLLIWDNLCIESALVKPNAISLPANQPATKYPRNLKKKCLVVRIHGKNIFWCLETVGREESSNFMWWISSRAKDHSFHVPLPEEDVHGTGFGHQ